MYRIICFLDKITDDLSSLTDITKHSDLIIYMRSPHIVCAIACYLLEQFNEEYFCILNKICLDEYPDDGDWYWIDGHIYIGPSQLEDTIPSIFINLQGKPWIYTQKIPHKHSLWKGLSDNVIIKLLKDKHDHVHKFGCKYLQYKLTTKITSKGCNPLLIEYIIDLLYIKDYFVLLELLVVIDIIIRKQISKTNLIRIKRVCMSLYVGKHILIIYTRLWYILQYIKHNYKITSTKSSIVLNLVK